MRTWTLRAVIFAILLIATAGSAGSAAPARLKDVARLEGVRPLPVIGYGLVAGLNKTGDRRQTLFSAQTLANMLEKFGLIVPGGQIKVENIAAVLVTGELPPFASVGARVDILVSSVGDARSLQGGTLLATPLRGPDGTVYALAQGPLTIGGFGAGRGGNSVQVNHLTAGRIPGGAIIQVTPSQAVLPDTPTIRLALFDPDFVTATRLADAINGELGPQSAQAVDPGTVTVKVPDKYRSSLADLMARLEPIPIEVDVAARVVINERTGTVVVGADVRLAAAAVAHGDLSVRISTEYIPSQPAPFSKGGETVVVPRTELEVTEGKGKVISLQEGTTLESVVRALNALGATPRDIIAIVQALKTAGALRAELVII